MQFTGEIRRLLLRSRGLDCGEPSDTEATERLWGAILDGALGDLEVGAVLAALAVAGETTGELVALHRAIHARLAHWSPALRERPVSIPVYGLVPGEAFIAALAAALLKRFRIPVVVHGILDSPCGMSTACVLRELGILPCASLAQADEHLDREGVAFLPMQLLSPAFASLVALRNALGIENSAHRVAQALDPVGSGSIRLAFSVAGAASARFDEVAATIEGDFVLLKWPAGRVPLNLFIRPRIERLHEGRQELLFEADTQEMRTSLAPAPEDAGGLARWIERVVTGVIPVPTPAVNMVTACLYAAQRAPDLAQAKAIAAFQTGRLAA